MGSIFQVSESTGNVTITGAVDVGSHQIHNVTDPTSIQDAATKNYVDGLVNGLTWKSAVQSATAAALPTNIYSNGASGVGATLTGVSNGTLVVDGYTVMTNDRILVKNEATASHNGVYTVTVTGSISTVYVLTRATDSNTPTDLEAGTAMFVENGTVNTNTAWVQTTTGTIVIGTTSLVYTQFSGVSGTISPGTSGNLATYTGSTTIGSIGGNTSANSFKITNLATPTASTDASTKGYVDSYFPVTIANGGTDLTSIGSPSTELRVNSSNALYYGANVINVMDYGATGNGSTDDTTAIQNAINSLSSTGGQVFFPVGTYKLSSTLTMVAGVSLKGVYVPGGAAPSSTLNQTGSVPVITLANSGGSPDIQVLAIEGLILSGGTDSIYAPDGGVGVLLRNILCYAPSANGLHLRGDIQEWYVYDLEVNGGQYGVLFTANGTSGSNQLMDKCHWYGVYFHGQSVNAMNLILNTGTGEANSFKDLRMAIIGQDGVVMDGGFVNVSFDGVSIEALGNTNPTVAVTTATTIASSANVTVASGTNLVNGQTVTIQGAGTHGQDWYPVILSGGGTTSLVMTTTAPTAVTSAELTNALYSGLKFPGNIRPIENFTLSNLSLIDGGLRYSLDLSGAAVFSISNMRESRPVYDPNICFCYYDETLTGSTRRPNNYIGESFATPTFGGIGAPRSVVNTPPGGNLTLALVDTNQNSSGTFGVLDVRIPATSGSTSATQIFKIDSTGLVTAPGGVVNSQAIVQGTTSTAVNSTSSSYVSSGITASITPTSSSHRIKVTVSTSYQINNVAGASIYIDIFRGATDLDQSGSGQGFFTAENVVATTIQGGASFTYIDSPATTSSTVYTVKFKNSNNSTNVSCPGNGCTFGSIILEEIV